MKMPYLDPVVRYGEKYASFAAFFRQIALLIDENPDDIFKYANHPALEFLLNDRNSTTYERTRYLEAFSYGDPGVLLASPGASLSGLMLRELGTKKQVDDFYSYLQKNNARTFFALTEPHKGSDAGALQCQILSSKNHHGRHYLRGEKCLFGNGAVGKIGVILARMRPGPLGIRAVLITPEELQSHRNWITRQNLPMVGLRGAQIAYMRFNDCPITSENLLGEHLRPMQQGMMAIIKTFNRLRSGVGSLAIGQAQAVMDFLFQEKKDWNHSERDIYCHLYYKIESARVLLTNSAKGIDQNPYDSYSISIAKVQASEIAEQVISTCLSMIHPAVILENQWLTKCYRDSFCWEYMEGTRNIQLKNVFHAFESQMNTKNIFKFNNAVNS